MENSSSSEFSAYVSIFKLQFDISEANCSLINTETGVKWTNIENTGYLKNSKCSYKTVVKPNTEIWVKKETMLIEAFVDHIYFYFNEFENVPNDVTGMPALSLFPNSDNIERTVLWEFISDGSVESLGFSLIFEEILHTMFLYANSSNIFQVITTSDLYAKRISINFDVVGPPIDVSTIILTNDKPYFAYHLCENNTPYLFNIQLSPELKLQNASIEMYSTLENIETAILFFSNESITHKMNFKNCFADNSDKSSCKTYKTEFSVFHFSDNAYYCYYSIYLLLQSSTHTNGCVFKNNIHNMNYDHKTYPLIVSAMSNNISSCRIFVFPDVFISHITSIWTTPKINGSLKIYAGSESKELAKIEAASTSSWRDIVLNSDIYNIEIPINAAIVIYVDFPINSKIQDFPYNSILTSPHFGEPKMKLDVVDKDPYMSFEIKNYDVQFSLIEYKLHSQIQFYFIVGGKARIK
uniref:CUB domain-containing protein n=1 Tax=Panagrolaimus davidi TaxID=227884 RepID=A0A914Q8W1_9BILA